MANLYCFSLRCTQTGHHPRRPRTEDSVYLEIVQGDDVKARWPSDGVRDMNPNDTARLGVVANYEPDPAKPLKARLWNRHGGDGTPELWGEYAFPAAGTGKGTLPLDSAEYGSSYALAFDQLAAPGNQVWLRSIQCIAPASALDFAVVEAALALSQEALDSFGKELSNAPDPRAQAVGGAMEAAAAVLGTIPNLAKAVADAGTWPDELYLSYGASRDAENQIYPTDGGTLAFAENDIDDPEYAKIFLPLGGSPVQIVLWDRDSSSPDDNLGSLMVAADAAIGDYACILRSAKEGSVYLLAYAVVPPLA